MYGAENCRDILMNNFKQFESLHETNTHKCRFISFVHTHLVPPNWNDKACCNLQHHQLVTAAKVWSFWSLFLWQCVLFYVAFSWTFTNFQLSEYFCFVSFLNVIGILCNGQFFNRYLWRVELPLVPIGLILAEPPIGIGLRRDNDHIALGEAQLGVLNGSPVVQGSRLQEVGSLLGDRVKSDLKFCLLFTCVLPF